MVDGETVHSGHWSARLERSGTSPEMFSTITKAIPIDFSGVRVEYRGFLRTEDVNEFTGLWLREDATGSVAVAFDNMQSRQIKGAQGWTEYSVTLPLRPEARTAVNQQLMFSENGFCYNGPHTAGPSDSHERRDGVDKEDDEIAHPLSYQFQSPQDFQRFVDFARHTFNSSHVTSLDWASYPIMKFEEIPDEIDILLLDRPDLPPTRVGEPASETVWPGVANAIYDAIGIRLRQLPSRPIACLTS